MPASPPAPKKTKASPLARLMQIARRSDGEGNGGGASAPDNPDPAIHRAIALHRESLLRHRLGLHSMPPAPPGATQD